MTYFVFLFRKVFHRLYEFCWLQNKIGTVFPLHQKQLWKIEDFRQFRALKIAKTKLKAENVCSSKI